MQWIKKCNEIQCSAIQSNVMWCITAHPLSLISDSYALTSLYSASSSWHTYADTADRYFISIDWLSYHSLHLWNAIECYVSPYDTVAQSQSQNLNRSSPDYQPHSNNLSDRHHVQWLVGTLAICDSWTSLHVRTTRATVIRVWSLRWVRHSRLVPYNELQYSWVMKPSFSTRMIAVIADAFLRHNIALHCIMSHFIASQVWLHNYHSKADRSLFYL